MIDVKVLVYGLIFIILIFIVILIVFMVNKDDIFRKGYKGYERVGGKSFTRKINIKVTEGDLRRMYKKIVEEEDKDDKYNTSFCKGQKICNKYCKDDVCKVYRDQKIVYDYCIDCEKKGLCWSSFKNSCVKCDGNNRGCNRRFGCDGESLKNPGRNFCKICWKQ